MTRPPMWVSGPVLDAADPVALARFYERLLGWPVVDEEHRWAKIRDPSSDLKFEFQWECDYAPRVWPTAPASSR